MALVTVQRSPNSVAESPQCSSDGEAEDEEGSKTEKSECFFAGKGTALVLALKDIPQHTERRLSTDSTRSTNSTQSNSSDIQQHLQSMFNLLPPEETLKMAVKLESQRPNRTRYLVIASRCCFRASVSERRSKISRNNSARVSAGVGAAAVAAAATARQLAALDNNSNKATQSQQLQQQLQLLSQSQSQSSQDACDTSELSEKRLSSLSTCSMRQRSKSEAMVEKSASGDSKSMPSVQTAADLEQGDGIEESCLLGIDCNERTTIGLVVPILADTTIHLDGDGGFSVSVFGKTHIFKPVSVQAMWSALQTLHKVSQKARENNFYPGGPSHDWLSYYGSRIQSDQSCLNEWNAMDSLESRRPPSPDAIRNKPTAKDETEVIIKMKLKEIMMSVDLDEVTSKYIRGRLEEHLNMDLGEFKSFIDEEMLIILGQMDAPTEIFEHVYLGSEWNASNLEELQKNGVRHILNVTREIDNFFPGVFDYFNVRVYDDEKTNLLKHWDNTYRYITRAKAEGSKVLVHCKMGVSRSASVVIAYAMKAYNWEFEQALTHVKERRNCIKPNKNFLAQLETYRGMLDAMLNKEKLQRSKSETNLKSTKDARLLPGSEPTPLIQALNHQSKTLQSSVVASQAKIGDAGGEESVEAVDCATLNATGGGERQQRRIIRRSSSTSPKSMHGHATITSTTVVIKQQSQSLENLTPERSIAADEPRNVRFPGNNGENYSVTQNQVLHIQKHTPPPPPPPPPPNSSVRHIVLDLEAQRDVRKTADDRKTLILPFSRSISSSQQENVTCELSIGEEGNQSRNQHQQMGSPVWTSSTKLTQTSHLTNRDVADVSVAALRRSLRRTRCDTFGSVSASSTDTDAGDMFSSQLDNVFAREEEEKRHTNRKTQSWAATTSAPVFKVGSNSSIDSAASANASFSYEEAPVRTRVQRPGRELPSRHASWGSGDNRAGVPMRNSSWGSYDTNRNTFLQYGSATTASAIFEGQIHELNMSNKTATSHAHSHSHSHSHSHNPPHPFGTVKRNKQKLEERTALKKLCRQENGAFTTTQEGRSGSGGLSSRAAAETERETVTESDTTHNMLAGSTQSLCQSVVTSYSSSPQKRSSNLYRSSSAAGAMRARYPNRCNSEEIMPSNMLQSAGGLCGDGGSGIGIGIGGSSLLPRGALRRSDGSRPLQAELFSASAPEAYTMSDIENKNTLPQQDVATEDAETADVMLRSTSTAANSTDDQRISGNVQILKKSFEAKAGVSAAPSVSISLAGVQTSTASMRSKGHQSLPSSPVALHVDHTEHNEQVNNAPPTTTDAASEASKSTAETALTTTTSTTNANANSNSNSQSSSSSSSSSSMSDPTYDRIAVKGLVHRYQPGGASTSSTPSPPTSTSITTTSTTGNYRPRPHSYYDHSSGQKSRLHEFSDSRPPPAPAKTASATATHRHTHSAITSNAGVTSSHAPITDSILTQQPQQQPPHRRQLQELSKSHPLTRLKMSQQTFNAAAYNTM